MGILESKIYKKYFLTVTEISWKLNFGYDGNRPHSVALRTTSFAYYVKVKTLVCGNYNKGELTLP